VSGHALVPTDLSTEHLLELRGAKALLESPRFAIRAANVIGAPLERGIARLPAGWRDSILSASRAALDRAADVALWSVDASRRRRANELLHKVAVAGTGAVGGAFGLSALALELPLSTTVMLRSIADIANAEGEDLRAPDAKLACLSVFTLGGRTASDDAGDSAYYIARVSLARAVSEAAQHLMSKHTVKGGAPPLLHLMQRIAGRFSLQVSEKFAAQALPVIGAAGGAWLNWLFIDHYQQMARGHFTIRRLERLYSTELIESRYRACPP
jgi:hypothetical protein